MNTDTYRFTGFCLQSVDVDRCRHFVAKGLPETNKTVGQCQIIHRQNKISLN